MKRTVAFVTVGVLLGFTACQEGPVAPLEEAEVLPAETPGSLNGMTPTPGRALVLAGMEEDFAATGKISWSGDGLGTTGAGGNLTINKPAGATVLHATFIAATTPSTATAIANGEMTLNGTPVNWDEVIPGALNAFGGQWNHRADVTAIVKPTLDAAAAGPVDIAVVEGARTGSIDGSALYVVFNDPAVVADHSVNILFGAQSTVGDNFRVNFVQPFFTGGTAQMSLSISFGFQPSGQFSTVDVNGQRLTSCAGGQDDGAGANGALQTTGGNGDNLANPDPNCSAFDGPFIDDELYDLSPFIPNGANFVDVFTQNPSNDDNIYGVLMYLSPPGSVVSTPGPGPGPGPGPQTCKEQVLALESVLVASLNALLVINPNLVSIPFLIQSIQSFFDVFVEPATEAQIAQLLQSGIFGQLAIALRVILGQNHPVVLALNALVEQCT